MPRRFFWACGLQVIEALVDTFAALAAMHPAPSIVSTAAAFVIAGAGVHVAKHMNRSISSRCGSADVLERLGVRIDLPLDRMARCIEEVGIGFLFAPAVHSATRHVVVCAPRIAHAHRVQLAGSFDQPGGASAQIAGVYEASLTELLARVLGELGVRRAFVVHGADGLDEISLAGETYVAELRDTVVRSYMVIPEDFGLRRAPLEAVRGGDADHNAQIIHKILSRSTLHRDHGPHRDIVLANAAAALVAAERATDFLDGVRIAAQSIDSGAARERLKRWLHSRRMKRGRRNPSRNFTAAKKPCISMSCLRPVRRVLYREEILNQTKARVGEYRFGMKLHPSTRSLQWRSPMMVPSAVSAEISSMGGSDFLSTISE